MSNGIEINLWTRGDKVCILQHLREYFSVEDINLICFELDIDYGDLAGSRKSEKAHDLVVTIDRAGRLSELVEILRRERPLVEWPGGTSPRQLCPYRGLLAFREEHESIFFGRQVFSKRLLQAVVRQPLVPIIGPSGSGKTSVIFAGLLPPIRRRGNWKVAHFRPQANPLNSLARSIVSMIQPTLSEINLEITTNDLAGGFADGKLDLQGILRQFMEKQTDLERILIICDQFEEIFTYCQDLEVRQRFLNLLLEAVATLGHEEHRLTVVTALRADFLGAVLAHRSLLELMEKNPDLKLGPMTPEELRLAIEQPALQTGLVFEAGLVERILDDVGDEPGKLPLLEFAMTELWRRQSNGCLTHMQYKLIDGVEGALARHANTVYQEFDPNSRQQARQLFVQLVHPGEGTEDVRRLARRSELSSIQWSVVQRLASKRLIVTGRDENNLETVEVAHEALIQRWDQLRDWIEKNREFRAWQERLRLRLREWQDSFEDEGTLLRGAPLAVAQEWLERRPEDLSITEQDYIYSSIANEERIRRREIAASRTLLRRTALMLGAIIVALVLAFLAFYSSQRSEAIASEATATAQRMVVLRRDEQYATAESELAYITKLAKARELAARSAERLERDPVSGLTDAIQAVNINYREDGHYATEAALALYRAMSLENPPLIFDHQGRIWAADYSPEGNLLVTAGADGMARLWTSKGEAITELSGHTKWIKTADFHPAGDTLVTAGGDGMARLWSTEGRLLQVLEGHNGEILAIACSPDGQQIVTAGIDGTARLWKSDGTLVAVLSGHDGPITTTTFSPDSSRVATAGDDATIRLWNLRGELVGSLTGHEAGINAVTYSQDGSLLATASDDATAILWKANGERVFTTWGHTGALKTVAFSPDGAHLVTAGVDDTAILWDVNGRLVSELIGHTDAINSATFSPDGNLILTGSSDGSGRLWDTAGYVLAIFEGHDGPVRTAGFNPDGTKAFTAGWDGTVRIWQFYPDMKTMLDQAVQMVLLDISREECFRMEYFPSWACPEAPLAEDMKG